MKFFCRFFRCFCFVFLFNSSTFFVGLLCCVLCLVRVSNCGVLNPKCQANHVSSSPLDVEDEGHRHISALGIGLCVRVHICSRKSIMIEVHRVSRGALVLLVALI